MNNIENKRVTQMIQVQTKGLELYKLKDNQNFIIIELLKSFQNKLVKSITITNVNICLINLDTIKDILYDLYICSGISIMMLNNIDINDTNFIKIQSDGLELFKIKNRDYGDAFAQYGVIGVIMRIQDKLQRSINIYNVNECWVNESIQDTLIDMHNYAAMAIMLLNEEN